STAADVRTTAPACSSARVAWSAWRRRSGTRDHPMSAAVASCSKPTWNTNAASPSDASSACTLSVGSAMRSQSRSKAMSVCPLSNHRPRRSNDQVAPPTLGARSSRVTSAPASAQASPAASPASPPPTTTTRPLVLALMLARSRRLPTRWLARCSAGYPPRGRSLACRAASTPLAARRDTRLADARSRRCSGEAAEGDPRLLARRERHSPFEDLERVRVDAAQEPPVDARHRGDARAAAVVEKRQQPQTVLEPRRRPLGLEAHQPGDRVTRPAHIRTYAEAGAILRRQVHATHRPVLDDVTEDVRELESDPQRVRERPGELRIVRTEDRERQAADRSGDEPAVQDELVVRVEVRASRVHLTPGDEVVEPVERNRESNSAVGDCEQDRVVVGRAARAHSVEIAPDG